MDGKDATQSGVNSIERVRRNSANNSDSPKTAVADCPAGKVAVGTDGLIVGGGVSGVSPDAETDVVIDWISPDSTDVKVVAYEEEPTDAGWSVQAVATCATAP